MARRSALPLRLSKKDRKFISNFHVFLRKSKKNDVPLHLS